jgi:hypothetical protein
VEDSVCEWAPEICAPSTTGQPYYDLILLYPLTTDEETDAANDPIRLRRLIAARARSVGMEAKAVASRDQDEVLLHLSASDAVLEKMAEHLTMEKRLKGGGYTDYRCSEKERFARAWQGSTR